MNKKILFAMAALALPALAQAQEVERRYSDTIQGDMVLTGNAIGLSFSRNYNCAGTSDGIGTFMSMDPTSHDDTPVCASGTPWPGNTTHDWTRNGSSAVLDIPDGAEIVHAELVWSAAFQDTADAAHSADESVEDYSGNAIIFKAEDNGKSLKVKPTFSKKIVSALSDSNSYQVYYYINSADITSFVKNNKAGLYSANGIPAVQNEYMSGVNGGGWTLAVVYSTRDAQMRNISLFVGGKFVQELKTLDYEVSGFCTPSSGDLAGKIFVSALEGDARSDTNYIGDSLQLAPTASDPFVALKGVNNAVNNFFASQINGSDGALDTRGLFGDVNHKISVATGEGTMVKGARQGWDITTLDMQTQSVNPLKNAQKSATVRISSGKDSLLPTLIGFQVDIHAPRLSTATSRFPKTSRLSANLLSPRFP